MAYKIKKNNKLQIAANIATILSMVFAIISLLVSHNATLKVNYIQNEMHNYETLIETQNIKISDLEYTINNNLQQNNINSLNSILGNNNNIITNNMIDYDGMSNDSLLKMAEYSMLNNDYKSAYNIYVLEKLNNEPKALNSLGIIYAIDNYFYDLECSIDCFELAIRYSSDHIDITTIQKNYLIALNKDPNNYKILKEKSILFCKEGNMFACSLLESAYTHEITGVNKKVDTAIYNDLDKNDFYSWNYKGIISSNEGLSPYSYGQLINYSADYIKLELIDISDSINESLQTIVTSYKYKVTLFDNVYLNDKPVTLI